MSVKLRFDSPSEGGVVQRSRSFTGLSSLTGRRRMRSPSLASGKYPRVHLYPSKVGGAGWSHQPEQVDQIFQALRKGLKEYLDNHQTEMDFLYSQQRDTKRNSRLAFLYDLEKEIRAMERFTHRLEFHISKVEELYESYCIQWRLCQGVTNMQRAFSLSPSSRASRDSLLELHRNHRHSLEDMSVIEGDLEILLGELHIKMKGLIGFARLCPGDQYEVVVRLGRQRWRLRGKIQSDDRQSWEEEEMVFLPYIHHNFQIKVMEAKGIGWQLIGMVTCASADFFVARSQLMVVDITELGTIKLQLEVNWNPFDSGDRLCGVSPSRYSVSSRKSSMYSWTPPTTPSFTEKYFISAIGRLQDPTDSLPSFISKSRNSRGGVSLLSYLADPAHTSSPPISTPPPFSYPSTPSTSQGTSLGGSHTQLSLSESAPPGATPQLGKRTQSTGDKEEEEEEEEEEGWRGGPAGRDGDPQVTLQRSSIPDLLRQNDPEASSGYALPPAPRGGSAGQDSADQASAVPPGPGRLVANGPQRRALSMRLGKLMGQLERSFQNQGSSEKEVRTLDNQVLHLGTILKNDLSLMKSSSDETLAVEEVLGSFDFLSRDFNADEETSCLGSVRFKDTGIGSSQQGTLRSLGLLSQDSQSVSEEELAITPLTSGNWRLDQALEIHLDSCCLLLQALGTMNSPLSRQDVLEEMTLQADALDRMSHLLLEKNTSISAGEILPVSQKAKDVLLFWEECTNDSGSPFCCHADSFTRLLRKRYAHKVKAKQPGQSEKVFCVLLEEVQRVGVWVSHSPSLSSPERVSLFQLSCYLQRRAVGDLGEHVSRLSKEVYLLSALTSPKRRRALKKLRGRRLAELLPLCRTLQTIAALQLDHNQKVCRAAASCLGRAASCKGFRSKAIVFYTEGLKDVDLQTQQAACLALKCLRAIEVVDQIAELWRSLDEDVRGAARETVLSFGKKAYPAFQRMEQLSAEMQEAIYQNQETHITIL